MAFPRDQFQERQADVDALLDLIAQLETNASSAAGSPDHAMFSASLPVLKASVFLVIYNLVESTVRQAFEWLYSEVDAARASYDALSPTIRKLWIKQHFARGMDVFSASLDQYHERVEALIERARATPIDALVGARLPVSGNLDADTIRDVCAMHGVSIKTAPALKGGIELATVRTQRNALAHGNYTFSESGRQFTVSDLRRVSAQTRAYLEAVIGNIERYASDRLYLAASPPSHGARKKASKRKKRSTAP